jgi:hypothetical protein
VLACRITLCLIPALALASGALAQDRPTTSASLKALTVQKHIRIHREGSEIRYAVDSDGSDKSGNQLPKGQVFVTKQTLKVTYQELNPLQTSVSVRVKGVENASASSLNKLLETIAAVGGIVKPAGGDSIRGASTLAADNNPSCQADVATALRLVESLEGTLHSETVSADRIRTEYKNWTEAITKAFGSGKDGQGAMQDGAAAIAGYGVALKKILFAGASQLQAVDKELSTDSKVCPEAVLVYQFIRLTNPHGRLLQLRALDKAVVDLEQRLRDLSTTGRWLNRDFIAAKDIAVDEATDADISIEVSDLTVEVGDGVFSLKHGEPISGAFVIQLDTGWVLEPSVGLVAGYVTRPKYGTSVDAAGNTIVARLDDDTVSVDPAVMVNFISRSGTSLLRPMVQIGAATSKDSPALFLGAGWRVLGKNKAGFAVSVGLMVAWVKDLQTLSPNDEVTGTKDIEADLQFDWAKPKPRFYWSLQYTF